ncbi:MAG TPA: DUF4440 domain-containing protein [Agriterribacter sp.]|nr:DUF4440 domain-containing protein [Agriterribacter sp.]
MRLSPIIMLAAIGLLVNSSCNLRFRKQSDRIEALNQLQQTDVDFSNRSKEVGMKKAFLEYIEKDGVLLRPGRMPIIGSEAVEFISAVNDSSFTLTWQPLDADISVASDLGYTYGTYNMRIKDSVYKGTYVTIWKKEKDGKWKFVLDTGNEGIGE